MTSTAKPHTGLREAKKAWLRDRILETALRRFRAQGYQATTIEQIVDELGISPATFYNYFGSKDAILGEIAHGALATTRALAEAQRRSEAPIDERLLAYGDAIAVGVSADKALFHTIYATGALNARGSVAKREVARAGFEALAELLAQGQQRGEVDPEVPAEQLAQVLQGIVLKLCADWSADFPRPHDLRLRMREALHVFLRGARPARH